MDDKRASESNTGRSYERRGKWVTVRTFSTAEQAHLVKLVLDRAGIPSYIDNENTGTTLWYAQPAIGGIKLRVPEPFEKQAQEVLEANRYVDDEEEEEPDIPDLIDKDKDEPEEEEFDDASAEACPACHSTGVVRFTWARRIGQALLVLCLSALWIFHPLLVPLVVGGAIYLLITKPDYRCLRCGKRWIAGR